MITSSQESSKGERIFRIALAVSLALHLILGFLVFAASDEASRLRAHVARPHPPRPDETVTISSAVRIEKRARAATGGHPRAVAAVPQPRVRPQQPAVERPAPAVRRRRVVPPATPPPLLRHEIAKLVPDATPQPPKTVPSERPAQRPVAVAPPQTESAARQPAKAHSAQLSQSQLAQIERDLAATISQTRSRANPLSNERHRHLAASTRRYAVDFSGLGGDLRGAQGVCYPVQEWEAQGYDYYYETCRTQHADGTVRDEPVPWPQRFLAANDPLRTEQAPGATIPLQLPPPGWKPVPGRSIDPDLLDYLRENNFPL